MNTSKKKEALTGLTKPADPFPPYQRPTSGSAHVELLSSATLAAGLGNFTEAQRLCDEVLGLQGLDASLSSEAWVTRGIARCFTGHAGNALRDWGRVINLPQAPPAQVAMALNNRGNLLKQKGQIDKAMSDYTRVIDSVLGVPRLAAGWSALEPRYVQVREGGLHWISGGHGGCVSAGVNMP